jgi:pimeloyl-ACP methyl ester carboxylesterase
VRARYPDDEGFVERDGVRVGYELYEGPEPTLLFAPQPAITHARGLKGVVPYLSRHFRVLVVDGRGNGRSDRPAEPEAYASGEFAADCIETMDTTETHRAIVVSFSARAIVGLLLCLEHAERVAAAVFVTPDLWATDYYLRQLARGAEEDDFNFDLMRADWPEFLRRWARRTYPRPHSTKQIEDFVAYGMDTDASTFIASIMGLGLPTRDEALEMASRISTPALVLQNGGDSVGPKEAGGAFAEASGAGLQVFEGLGPVVSSRWPVAFNLVLREFAEAVRAGAVEPPVATRS